MIENIIFDLGDVFIDLDYKRSQRELLKLGIDQFSGKMIEINQKYEKGLISTDDFVKYYLREFPHKTKQQLVIAWNSILGDFPINRLTFLEELSQKHQLFLLSNTNELHINQLKNQVGNQFYQRFINSFKKVYYSFEIKYRKPETDAYKIILNENNLDSNQTLFVDDLLENTNTATLLGMKTWNLNPNKEDVTSLFSVKKNLFNKVNPISN